MTIYRTGFALIFSCLILAPSHVQSGNAAACAQVIHTHPIPDIGLQPVVRGLERPVHISASGDGSDRLFIVEQAGTIRILEKNKLVPTPYLDIRSKVRSGGEMGLLSIAFHPLYQKNGRFFVYYTERRSGDLVSIIAEYRRRDAYNADTSSERIVMTVAQPYSNHNGGQLAFGPDGMLYIGLGDGGAANDPKDNGQNLATLLGALLRIDIDRRDIGHAYAIPKDNPFVGKAGYRGELWAYGLRNPWRFSFDPADGQLYAADVGQDEREEIDIIVKGGNYGWRIMEGSICTPDVNSNCRKIGRAPLWEYDHLEGQSVTGGVVYRGRKIPDLCGVYLFADYVSGRLWGLRQKDGRVTRHRRLAATGYFISTFGVDRQYEVYVADHQRGTIYRLTPAP